MRSSSTSRDARLRPRRSRAVPLALMALLLASRAAVAVRAAAPEPDAEPERAMSQYMREAWGTERGFPGGPVYGITQTPDGYLWIGTEKGLVRFDGVTFTLVEASPQTFSTAAPAAPAVLGLVTDGVGDLWLRLAGPGPLRYRAGRFEAVPAVAEPAGSVVTAMCRGTDGAVVISGLVGGTRRFRAEAARTLLANTALPASIVISLAETADGHLWVGTRDAGLFALRDGRLSTLPGRLPDRKINCLAPIDARQLWIGTDNGIARWNGTTLTTAGLPSSLAKVQALAMLRDRVSNVWIGTASHGLVRVTADGTTTFDAEGRRSNGAVTALFEDREGNLWTGHANGIERLRDSAFVTYSTAEGLPSDSSGPVYVDAAGRTWFAPAGGGLAFLDRGRVVRVTAAGLDADLVYSIAGGPRSAAGDIWIGRQRGGLTRLREIGGGRFVAESYTQADGLAQNSVYAVHVARDGAVWAGTLSGGLSRVAGGRFTTYTVAHGLAANTITAIAESADGTIWVGTPNGISAWTSATASTPTPTAHASGAPASTPMPTVRASGAPGWRAYAMRDALPSDDVSGLLVDEEGVLWVGTSGGLAFLRDDRLQAPRVAGDPPRGWLAGLREPVVGLAADRRGALWIATSRRVLRVSRAALLRGDPDAADVRELGLADGLHAVEGVKRHRSVVADARGRIWLSMNRGLSVVDPERRAGSAAPSIVHVQAVAADGVPIALPRTDARTPAPPLDIPSGRQRLAFTYAGVSLSVPERVRYRYRLDGFDRDWSEPAAAREAIYTNLGPGSYQFRVMATNGEGQWNGAEARLALAIAPAYWQTWWFRISAAIVFVLGAAALYRVRLHRVTRQLNIRFEERLAERTRIAQELHDTLLQGFLSASMQLHVAVDRLPADSPEKPLLTRVQDLMRQVIDDGRRALRGLRSTGAVIEDLDQALSRVPQQLAFPADRAFRVIVEGRTQPLPRSIRDEVYSIGREALVNAFRHSNAASIEVQIEYAASHLRLLVRDDGRGIDPEVVRSGRDGHWGLSGMRERAERIGARLTVWSRVEAGTEIELSVPGPIAFPLQPQPSWHAWRRRLLGR